MGNVNGRQKTILIASPFFFPEPISTARYNTFLSKKLVKKNKKVTVICSHPFYPEWKTEFTREALDGVIAIRGGLKIVYPGSTIFRRLVLEAWYSWHFFKEARRLKGAVDTVVAVVPPVFFTFFVTLGFRKCKKIAVVHDLLGVMATTSNSFARRLVSGIIKPFESFLLRRFKNVVCLSEAMKSVLVNRYGLNARACDVHYPFVTIGDHGSDCSLLENVFPVGFKHIVYSGALGEKQKPWELYQFFEDACNFREDLCCHIFSGGPIHDALQKRNRHTRIFFHDLVPDSHLPALYACSDIQVLPQAEGTGCGAFPSKLPNLIAAGVPVLAICDKNSELGEMVEKVQAGKTVFGWDTRELLQGLESLLVWSGKESRADRRARTKKHILENFDVNRLIDLIVRLSGR